MKRMVVNTLILLVVAIFCSSVWAVRPDSFFSSTIYTVSGIMFSIGLGLIVTFNPSGVKNKNYINALRVNIANVRNSFLTHFGLSTVYYVLNQYLADPKYEIHLHYKIDISFSYSIFLCLLMFYSAIYFVVNFIEIQKLNNDIFDNINKEQQ
ncbi:hypothetical protein BVG91_10265 [Serratia marcescens]|nr:hypothetical protein BVG91_10265 [Serratia marcescens]